MDNVKPTSTLDRFPPIPRPGRVTICEAANTLKTIASTIDDGPIDFSSFISTPESYHHIMGNNLKPVVPSKIPSIRLASAETRDNFIVAMRSGPLKGMWNAWFDGGFLGALNYLQTEDTIPVPIKSAVANILYFWDTIQKSRRKLLVRIYPHYGLEIDDLIDKYSSVRDWKKSWIRAITWHPTCSKLAIALQDDSVRVLTNGVYDGFHYVKSIDQTKVSSLSWRPYSERELAIGVEAGVIVWELDGSLKPPSHRSRLLKAKGHSPVTCVQYSANARHLVSSSSLDSSIYIWCTSSYEPFILHRFGGGGVPLAQWSPSGTQLFSTTPTSSFKVWSGNNQWTPARWRTAGMPVEAMCWSPDGGMIIFASGSLVFSILVLQFEEDFVDSESVRSAMPVFDLRTTEIQQEGTGDYFKVGDKVVQMVISPCGSKLAMIFSDSELVALFRLQQKSPDLLYPVGFIRGYDNEYPVAIEFQRNMESGALLTIAWSSTRLQHFPMLTSNALVSQRLYEEDQMFYYPSGMLNASASFGMTQDNSFFGSSRPRNSTTSGGQGLTSGLEAGDFERTGSFHAHDPNMSQSQFKIFSTLSHDQ